MSTQQSYLSRASSCDRYLDHVCSYPRSLYIRTSLRVSSTFATSVSISTVCKPCTLNVRFVHVQPVLSIKKKHYLLAHSSGNQSSATLFFMCFHNMDIMSDNLKKNTQTSPLQTWHSFALNSMRKIFLMKSLINIEKR